MGATAAYLLDYELPPEEEEEHEEPADETAL